MIDRARLLEDLKPVLWDTEVDLRARCDEVSEIEAGLKNEYEEAVTIGQSVRQMMAWTPPPAAKGRGRKKKAEEAE